MKYPQFIHGGIDHTKEVRVYICKISLFLNDSTDSESTDIKDIQHPVIKITVCHLPFHLCPSVSFSFCLSQSVLLVCKLVCLSERPSIHSSG